MGNKPNHYAKLRNKWIKKHRDLQQKLWADHGDVIHEFITNTKNFAIGSISGLMLLSSPITNLLSPPDSLAIQENKIQVPDKSVFLISDLRGLLPKDVRPLNQEEKENISAVLSRDFGLDIRVELDGITLNRNYGYIGAEQHLARYPGDTMATHFDPSTGSGQVGGEADEPVYGSGMAPGLGAWGYFASPDGLTEEDKLREKYYIAAQTFLAPGFNENVRKFVDFFKYRKMLVVNPDNGHSMVVVIGDAGPAEWTGKSLGGSPEVMKYLERVDGRARGSVLYYFINDPEGVVPLGPIEPK